MISIAMLRLVGVVAAVSIGIGALWYLADAIGDAREAKVRASYDQAIDMANTDTIEANDVATKIALRDERVRTDAIAAYRKSLGTACPLTADEATTLGRIR